MDKRGASMVKEGDLVLCTVRKIEGATVFLTIEDNGEGSMMLSEVAAGRIRNLREYVVPGKRIVCKVLRIANDHAELSLRRVSAGERDAVMAEYKNGHLIQSLIKPVVGENTKKILESIRKEYTYTDFIQLAKEDPSLITQFATAKEGEQLLKIFKEKSDVRKEIKKAVTLKTMSPHGIIDIQETLKTENADIRYLGSSRFMISVEDKDFKKANTKMEQLLKIFKERAKERKLDLEIK